MRFDGWGKRCGLALLGVGLSSAAAEPLSVTLNDNQAKAITIGTVGEKLFAVETSAVGSVDFNEDRTVAVFPPYPGKIIDALPQLGDEVKKGQTLYSIESPDLIAAEGTLIGARASLDMTSRALARAKELFANQGLAQKDLEQAAAEQESAEGTFTAARNAVLLFGKSAAEIDHIVSERRIDPAMLVPSPISGRVTLRNAQPGQFVQPGTEPAPYSIADLSVVWLLANVPESNSASVHVGQSLRAAVLAYPDRIFEGEVARLASSVDPALHTVTARAEIKDPDHLLRPGMIASFRIALAPPQKSVALPVNGVVREGDGTMTAWVTTDRHHFTQRIVKVGLQQDGFRQILDGLRAGESAVTDGAILLDNIAAVGAPS